MVNTKRRKPDIQLSAAIEGHLRYVRSVFSVHTLKDYQQTHDRFLAFHGDCLIKEIEAEDVIEFIIHMRETPIQPAGVTAETQKKRAPRFRKPKTLANMHAGLGALWTWAVERGYAGENVVHSVPKPKVNQEPIRPLSADEVVALLRACHETKPWHNKPLAANYRPSAERDKAMIGLMVETALRVAELCNLKYEDLTLGRGGGKIFIEMGKGKKSREVPFSKRCANLLHAYLLTRPDIEDEDWLFVNTGRNAGQQLQRGAVFKLISRMGKKVGIHTSPHHLRTTAACLMVVNGMTAFELQQIMGHSNIRTTMRYVQAAQIDLEGAMRQASPLDNLRL